MVLMLGVPCSELFIGIFILKMYSFLYANSNEFQTKILHLLRFYIILPPKIFRLKKNRSFLLLLWAEIFLRKFTKFIHKRAILCAPIVPPVYALKYNPAPPLPTHLSHTLEYTSIALSRMGGGKCR